MAELKTVRAVLDAVLGWAAFAYGLFATAVEPVWHQDSVRAVTGAEMVVVALIGFLWAGERRALGTALVVAGAAAPLAFLGNAPLYWDEVELFHGEAFWTSIGGGAAVGLPLILLGILVLRRSNAIAPERDPWWLRVVRWAVQGGLLLVVLAFRGGDWDRGVPIVYAGTALALVSLLVVLPRRIRITRRGIGLLLALLGLAAFAVIGVAQAFVGGHMSGDEAAAGLLPAGVALVVGLLLAATGRGRTGGPVAAGPKPDLDGVLDRAEDTVGDSFRDVADR